jgi:hypothetical protein
VPLLRGVCAHLRRRTIELFVASLVLLASGAGTVIAGQSVRGRVVDAVASTPIPDANLQLVDRARTTCGR